MKEIIKSQAEINDKEMKETLVRINKTKSWFSEKTNKIDKSLARFNNKKTEKNQINKIINEKSRRHKRKAIYANKLGNLKEMD